MLRCDLPSQCFTTLNSLGKFGTFPKIHAFMMHIHSCSALYGWGEGSPPFFEWPRSRLRLRTRTRTHTHTYSSTLCIVERIKGLHRHADMLDLTQAHGRYCIYIQPGTIKDLRAFSAFLGAKRI